MHTSLRRFLPAFAGFVALVLTASLIGGEATTYELNLLTAEQHTFMGQLGWTDHQNAVASHVPTPSAVHQGSLRIMAGPGDSQVAVGTPTGADGVAVEAGMALVGSIRVQTSAGQGSARCEVNWFDGADTLATSSGDTQAVTMDRWTQLTCTGRAPAAATTASMRVVLDDAADGDLYFADDAWLTVDEQAPAPKEPAPSETPTTPTPSDPEEAATNLLTQDQEEFAGSDSGWVPQGNTLVRVVDVPAADGPGSLQVTVDESGLYADDTKTARVGTWPGRRATSVEAGDKLSGSVFVGSRRDAATGRCEIRWYNDSGRILTTSFGPSASVESGHWTRLTCEAEAPTEAVYASFRVYLADAAYGEVFHVDDAWMTTDGLDAIPVADAGDLDTGPDPTPEPTSDPSPEPTSDPAPEPTSDPSPDPPSDQTTTVADRGPIGRTCPRTPEYRTPATHTATASTLQNVLDDITASRPSGDVVIETTGLPSRLSGGSATSDRNVLIRPPLGQLGKSSSGIDNRASGVTFAGWTFTGNIRTRGEATNQWYMWSVVENTATILVTNAKGGGLCEVAFPDRGNNGDTMQIKGWDGDYPVGYHILGVWFEGKDRTDPAVHNDTIQITSCVDCIVEDSVLYGSTFSLLAGPSQGPIKNLRVRNSWLGDGTGLAVSLQSQGAVLTNNDIDGSVRMTASSPMTIEGNRIGRSLVDGNLNSLVDQFPDNDYRSSAVNGPNRLDLSVWR